VVSGKLKKPENARFIRGDFEEVALVNCCREMGPGILGLKIEEKKAPW